MSTLASVAIAGDLTFTDLSPSRFGHTCGLTSGGVAYCWGLNQWGELGNGTIDPSLVPVRVAPPIGSVAGATARASVVQGRSTPLPSLLVALP